MTKTHHDILQEMEHIKLETIQVTQSFAQRILLEKKCDGDGIQKFRDIKTRLLALLKEAEALKSENKNDAGIFEICLQLEDKILYFNDDINNFRSVASQNNLHDEAEQLNQIIQLSNQTSALEAKQESAELDYEKKFALMDKISAYQKQISSFDTYGYDKDIKKLSDQLNHSLDSYMEYVSSVRGNSGKALQELRETKNNILSFQEDVKTKKTKYDRLLKELTDLRKAEGNAFKDATGDFWLLQCRTNQAAFDEFNKCADMLLKQIDGVLMKLYGAELSRGSRYTAEQLYSIFQQSKPTVAEPKLEARVTSPLRANALHPAVSETSVEQEVEVVNEAVNRLSV
ncbi:MAG: hypothetical protein SFW66_04930 [Gammaproteobacteria bacterium]|nr:hypothetical protein [Gammaproteobacteria bacterium]